MQKLKNNEPRPKLITGSYIKKAFTVQLLLESALNSKLLYRSRKVEAVLTVYVDSDTL